MKAYLPIGTVVLLRGGGGPLLIYGRQQLPAQRDRVWDYCACPYPEGALPRGQVAFFNQEDIRAVLFRGYDSPEEQAQQHTLRRTEESLARRVY